MEFVSYIMLKLAWIIPLIGLSFAVYVAFLTHKSNKRDANIKKNGVDIEAIIRRSFLIDIKELIIN